MRALTLGDLVAEVARRAIDPNTAVIAINGEPLGADSSDYDIEHGLGGVTVDFAAYCTGNHDD